MVLATPPEHPSRLRVEDGIYLSDGRQVKPTTSRPQEPTLQREGSARELPESVKNLIEARTGDADTTQELTKERSPHGRRRTQPEDHRLPCGLLSFVSSCVVSASPVR